MQIRRRAHPANSAEALVIMAGTTEVGTAIMTGQVDLPRRRKADRVGRAARSRLRDGTRVPYLRRRRGSSRFPRRRGRRPRPRRRHGSRMHPSSGIKARTPGDSGWARSGSRCNRAVDLSSPVHGLFDVRSTFGG